MARAAIRKAAKSARSVSMLVISPVTVAVGAIVGVVPT